MVNLGETVLGFVMDVLQELVTMLMDCVIIHPAVIMVINTLNTVIQVRKV